MWVQRTSSGYTCIADYFSICHASKLKMWTEHTQIPLLFCLAENRHNLTTATKSGNLNEARHNLLYLVFSACSRGNVYRIRFELQKKKNFTKIRNNKILLANALGQIDFLILKSIVTVTWVCESSTDCSVAAVTARSILTALVCLTVQLYTGNSGAQSQSAQTEANANRQSRADTSLARVQKEMCIFHNVLESLSCAHTFIKYMYIAFFQGLT